ncbi:hypothetical protein [Kitasatospora sp. NPDC050463]|uniref:hypothetical protein n=1 Tax=Kitasatospora sp. NPDC050463 TaxID=3155786 RepID=UPI0033E1FBA8
MSAEVLDLTERRLPALDGQHGPTSPFAFRFLTPVTGAGGILPGIRAGHTPALAEALIGRAASWSDAPPAAITSFAVAQAGYWERNSRLPAPPGVPYLRDYQARMAAVGRGWIAHRTGWR